MDMAKESRVDEGLQLITRASRHYKCSRFGSLLHDTVGCFKLKNGDIGISVKKVVPASFKTDMYTTEAAFTSTAIIACKCSCAAGSKEVNHHDRHVDVYVLPLVMSLMELLMNPSCGLTESILISLAACWGVAEDRLINTSEHNTMVNAINILYDATTG